MCRLLACFCFSPHQQTQDAGDAGHTRRSRGPTALGREGACSYTPAAATSVQQSAPQDEAAANNRRRSLSILKGIFSRRERSDGDWTTHTDDCSYLHTSDTPAAELPSSSGHPTLHRSRSPASGPAARRLLPTRQAAAVDAAPSSPQGKQRASPARPRETRASTVLGHGTPAAIDARSGPSDAASSDGSDAGDNETVAVDGHNRADNELGIAAPVATGTSTKATDPDYQPLPPPGPLSHAHSSNTSLSARRLLARRLQEHAAQRHPHPRLATDRKMPHMSPSCTGLRDSTTTTTATAVNTARLVRLTSDSGSPRTTNRALLTRQRTPYALRRLTGTGGVACSSGGRSYFFEVSPYATGQGTAGAAALGTALAAGWPRDCASVTPGDNEEADTASPSPAPHTPGRLFALQHRCPPPPPSAGGASAWPPVRATRVVVPAAFIDSESGGGPPCRGLHGATRARRSGCRARFVDAEGDEPGPASPRTRAPALLMRQQTPFPLQWGRNWFIETGDGDSGISAFASGWTETGGGGMAPGGVGSLMETQSHGLADCKLGGRMGLSTLVRATYSGAAGALGSVDPLASVHSRARAWSRVGSLRGNRVTGPEGASQTPSLHHPHVSALRVRPSLCKSRRPSVSSSLDLCADPDPAAFPPIVLHTSYGSNHGANTPTRRGRRRNLAGNEQFGWDTAVLARAAPAEEQLPTPFGLSPLMPPPSTADGASSNYGYQAGAHPGPGPASFGHMASPAAAVLDRAQVGAACAHQLLPAQDPAPAPRPAPDVYVAVPGSSRRRFAPQPGGGAVWPSAAQPQCGGSPGMSLVRSAFRLQSSSYASLRMLDIEEAPSPLAQSPLAAPGSRPRCEPPPMRTHRNDRRAIATTEGGSRGGFSTTLSEYAGMAGAEVVAAQLISSQSSASRYAARSPAIAGAASPPPDHLNWSLLVGRATQSMDGTNRGLLLPFDGRKPLAARTPPPAPGSTGSFRRAGPSSLRHASGTDNGMAHAAAAGGGRADNRAHASSAVGSREGRRLLRHTSSVRSTAPTEDDSAESLPKLGSEAGGRGGGCGSSCAADLADSLGWASLECAKQRLVEIGYGDEEQAEGQAVAAEEADEMDREHPRGGAVAAACWQVGGEHVGSPKASALWMGVGLGSGQGWTGGQGQAVEKLPRPKSVSMALDGLPAAAGGSGCHPLRHPALAEVGRSASMASASRLSRCT